MKRYLLAAVLGPSIALCFAMGCGSSGGSAPDGGSGSAGSAGSSGKGGSTGHGGSMGAGGSAGKGGSAGSAGAAGAGGTAGSGMDSGLPDGGSDATGDSTTDSPTPFDSPPPFDSLPPFDSPPPFDAPPPFDVVFIDGPPPPLDGGVCNSLPLPPAITVVGASGTLPTGTGGAIPAGTYYLTGFAVYAGGPTTLIGSMVAQDLVLTSATLGFSYETVTQLGTGAPDYTGGTASFVGIDTVITETCPSSAPAGSGTYTYDPIATTATLYASNVAFTYALQ